MPNEAVEEVRPDVAVHDFEEADARARKGRKRVTQYEYEEVIEGDRSYLTRWIVNSDGTRTEAPASYDEYEAENEGLTFDDFGADHQDD